MGCKTGLYIATKRSRVLGVRGFESGDDSTQVDTDTILRLPALSPAVLL